MKQDVASKPGTEVGARWRLGGGWPNARSSDERLDKRCLIVKNDSDKT